MGGWVSYLEGEAHPIEGVVETRVESIHPSCFKELGVERAEELEEDEGARAWRGWVGGWVGE